MWTKLEGGLQDITFWQVFLEKHCIMFHNDLDDSPDLILILAEAPDKTSGAKHQGISGPLSLIRIARTAGIGVFTFG